VRVAHASRGGAAPCSFEGDAGSPRASDTESPSRRSPTAEPLPAPSAYSLTPPVPPSGRPPPWGREALLRRSVKCVRGGQARARGGHRGRAGAGFVARAGVRGRHAGGIWPPRGAAPGAFRSPHRCPLLSRFLRTRTGRLGSSQTETGHVRDRSRTETARMAPLARAGDQCVRSSCSSRPRTRAAVARVRLPRQEALAGLGGSLWDRRQQT